jgi:hypothetical protein
MPSLWPWGKSPLQNEAFVKQVNEFNKDVQDIRLEIETGIVHSQRCMATAKQRMKTMALMVKSTKKGRPDHEDIEQMKELQVNYAINFRDYVFYLAKKRDCECKSSDVRKVATALRGNQLNRKALKLMNSAGVTEKFQRQNQEIMEELATRYKIVHDIHADAMDDTVEAVAAGSELDGDLKTGLTSINRALANDAVSAPNADDDIMKMFEVEQYEAGGAFAVAVTQAEQLVESLPSVPMTDPADPDGKGNSDGDTEAPIRVADSNYPALPSARSRHNATVVPLSSSSSSSSFSQPKRSLPLTSDNLFDALSQFHAPTKSEDSPAITSQLLA